MPTETDYPADLAAANLHVDADDVIADQYHQQGEQPSASPEDVVQHQAPAPRRPTKLLAFIALGAVVVLAGAAFLLLHSGHRQPPEASNPELAAIQREANTVPVHQPAPALKAPYQKPTAPKPTPSATALAGGAPTPAGTAVAPVPAVNPTGHSPTLPAPSSAIATAKPAPAATAATVPTGPSPAEYQAALAQIASLRAEIARSDAAPVPEPKVRVVYRKSEPYTVRAVLKDGVVLRSTTGKTIIVQTGDKLP